jgi:hypothetical protein
MTDSQSRSAYVVRQWIILLNGDSLVLPDVIRAIDSRLKSRYKHVSVKQILVQVSDFTLSPSFIFFVVCCSPKKSQQPDELGEKAKNIIENSQFCPPDILVPVLAQHVSLEYQELLSPGQSVCFVSRFHNHSYRFVSCSRL